VIGDAAEVTASTIPKTIADQSNVWIGLIFDEGEKRHDTAHH